MFTNFSQKLNGLFGIDGFPPEAAELIISVLTQCNAPLEHRAEVTTPTDGSSGTGASYAIALGTWTRAAGHGSYVSCRAASDPIGTLTSDATAFNVYLPRSNAAMDPNVYINDILQYVEIGGVKYAVGESYLDAKVGTLRELYHATVPHGWQHCDGSGSTPDLREQFTQGSIDNTDIGDTGGSLTHSHETGYSIVYVLGGGGVDPVQGGSSSTCSGGPKVFDPGSPLVCNVDEDPRPPWTKVYKIIRVGPSGEIS